ncbi:MAG: hypothetical protein R3250_18590 [Melioribacteraceae bacterium]|nr:hypothetical protein [Melioribacteraceae bacterium]
MITLTKRRIGILLSIIILLLIPLIAMQFTDEVNWDISDFAIMAFVLTGIALAYEIIAVKSGKTVYKIALGIALLGVFLLFWVNGAVGIIGNEDQPANMLFGAVFIVGLTGSLISRFKPLGMSNTLYISALVQMIVPASAYFIWPPPETSWSPSVFGVFFLSSFFAILFIISAMLFRQASKN